MNGFVLLEAFGPLYVDTSIILRVEYELEGGRRTSLDKMDKYFYATIFSVPT